MNRKQSMQKPWALIMGAITLLVSLFFPRVSFRVEGFFWQLLSTSPASTLDQIIRSTSFLTLLLLFFPPCILTAGMIWLWIRQMYWQPAIVRGMLVVLEATGLAFLLVAVFSIVLFVIPNPGNGWGIAFALFNTMWTGVAFLAFLPCLWVAAIVLASLQRKYQADLYERTTASISQGEHSEGN